MNIQSEHHLSDLKKIKGKRFFYNFLKTMKIYDSKLQTTYFNTDGKCLIWCFHDTNVIFVDKDIKTIYNGDDILNIIEKFISNKNIEIFFIK